ncbi:MAG: J domain-containing protein [Sphingomonadales bacterium]
MHPGSYIDHYQILGLAPGATPAQIKKAWRKGVLELHPDKTGNDPALSIRFAALQQAYEVLSDPLKKIQFLQERWLRKAQGQSNTTGTLDLAAWIKDCVAQERKTSTQDADRIDQQALQLTIEELVSPEKIALLRSFAHPEALLTGARLLLHAATVLSFDRYKKVTDLLIKVEPADLQWQQEIQKGLLRKKREHSWDRYRVALLILLSILLCLLIAS